jgi:hypothetical protein
MKWYRKHFLITELAIASGVLAAFVVWVQCFEGVKVVEDVLGDRREAIYGTAASIAASLLGFVLATTAIVIGYSQNERMKLVRSSEHYPTLWKILVASIRALSAATVASGAALVLDRRDAPMRALVFLVVGTGILAILRVARCIWILEKVISVISRPETDANALDESSPG